MGKKRGAGKRKGKEESGWSEGPCVRPPFGAFSKKKFEVMKFPVCPSFIRRKPHLAHKKNMILHYSSNKTNNICKTFYYVIIVIIFPSKIKYDLFKRQLAYVLAT